MPTRDIIAIGASAGGIDPLRRIIGQLPADLPASVFVILHVAPRSTSYLPQILANSGALPVVHAADGEKIVRSRIYVAPPDHHLVVERDHMHLSSGPKEQHHRPSINVAFRSAAAAYKDRVAGIVLSGELDDGTAGLWEIKRQGGIAVVQNPEEAECSSMPLSALREVEADYTLKASEIGGLITRLAGTAPPTTQQRGEIASEDIGMERVLTDVTCPECRGTIWEVRRGKFKDYECRVGHTYSAKTMLAEHFAAQENILYAALVALSEGASLAEKLAGELDSDQGERLRQQARKRLEHAETIRRMLADPPQFTLG